MCWSSFTLPSSSGDDDEQLAEGPGVDEPEVAALLERRRSHGCAARARGGRCRVGTGRSSRNARPSTSPPSRVSRMYLPRRSVLVTLCPARRDVNSFRVLWRRIDAHRVLRALDLDRLDLLANDVAVQIATHHLDFGKLHPLPPRCLPVARPRCAFVGLACGLLLGFLLGAPDARAQPLPRHHDRGGELLLVVGTRFLDLDTPATRAAPATRAPAGSSCKSRSPSPRT